MPITIGGFIYVFFRSKTLRLFFWLEKIGVLGITNDIRLIVYPLKRYLPEWFLNSLPDGLWVYSFSAMLFLVWKDFFIQNKILLMLPFVMVLVLEAMQLFEIINGTFDVMDVVTSLIMNLVLIKILKVKYNEKSD